MRSRVVAKPQPKASAQPPAPALRAVSLFSNCGAGDIGFREAGFHFDVMAELDKRRLAVCLLNHPGAKGVPGDLRDTWQEGVKEYRTHAGDAEPALLAACPPCQGLSSARSARGLGHDADAGSKDPRNLLVVVIASVALELRPQAIVVENVPQFFTRKVRHPETREAVSAATLLIETLRDDYEVFPILVDLAHYGVPQTRKRAFLTFIRRDVKGLESLTAEGRAPFPRPTHGDGLDQPVITLRKALTELKLPSLDAGSDTTIGHGLHQVPLWLDCRYQMVAAIPPHTGGSAWQNRRCVACGDVDVEENDARCPECGEPLLRPVVKDKATKSWRLINGFKSSSYRRMHSDLPASTITTASGHIGSDLTIHPFENRLLSTLECAGLQTFPTDFQWGEALEKWGHTLVREMIGEAVPPLFTRLHGAILMGVLTGQWTSAPISASDPRCKVARKKLGL